MADSTKKPENLPEFIALLKNEKNIKPEHYRMYIDRFIDDKAREKGIPLNGKFELTPLCNLDCKMCYVHLQKNQMQQELLPVSTWKKLAKEAFDMGMTSIELTGGEALSYPGFDELYLYLHSLGLEVSVFTNGILLDEKRVEFFVKHPPKHLQITLYGDCEDTYEEVTGHRQFERITRNIENARDHGIPIIVTSTPSRYMVGKGENIVRKVHEMGLPMKINFSLFEPRDGTDRHAAECEAPIEEYIRMNRLLAELNGRELSFIDEAELPDLGEDSGKKEFGMRCGAGRSTFFIDWKGTMHPCISLYMLNAYPLRDGFEKAWKETNHTGNTFPLPVECIDCKYRHHCYPCVALHMQGAEIGHANPEICRHTKRMISEGIIKLD